MTRAKLEGGTMKRMLVVVADVISVCIVAGAMVWLLWLMAQAIHEGMAVVGGTLVLLAAFVWMFLRAAGNVKR